MIRSCISFLFFCALALGQTADWVVSARYVVTMDPSRRLIDNGAVAVRGRRIAGVGALPEMLARFPGARRLDRPQAILMPGLVNAHAHAPMSLLRGIADDRKLREWLEKYIFPAEARNVNPEFVRWGTRLACLEMGLSGITTYADMYYFEEQVAEATREAGMRGVLGQTIINFPVPDAKTPAEGLKRTEAFVRRFQKDSLIVPAVAPHAPYTNTEESLRAARALANRYGVPLLTHLSETRTENEEMRAKRGISPAQFLDKLGLFEGRTLVAHAVWVDEADRKILRARGVGVAHCPSSNMKLASGIAPVAAMLDLGLAVGLGTDGPAGSNNDLDLFEEMDLAAKLQKVATGNPQVLAARQAVEMATLGGARAMQMEKEIGSLEPGKLADLITVAIDQPHAVPMFDVYSQLVYALKASDVRDVMVDGKLILRDRQWLTLQSAPILAKAREYQAALAAQFR